MIEENTHPTTQNKAVLTNENLRNKAAKSGSSPASCSEWIPASTPPPLGTFSVIVKGGNYMISEAIYMRDPVTMMSGATKPPGFYLSMGGGNILDAEWVEWWIPMPSLPNAFISGGANNQ